MLIYGYTRLFFIENQLIKVDVEQKNGQEILVSTNQTISPKIKKELIRKLTCFRETMWVLQKIYKTCCRLKQNWVTSRFHILLKNGTPMPD
ncbi:hypothetical protein [Legionella bozemanae]|uniref:hypothetical protein n=1 Tax=Legionella bozemanae TaxID=447 RepID=UPI00216B197A|nr:hypothetical protein [Legionella bozemanae]